MFSGLYYGITIAIVSATTAMTVLTLNIHHKGSRGLEVPQGVKKVFFGIFAKILFIRLDLPHPPERDMVSNSLRKHAYSNILKFSPPKTENFQIKKSDIFHNSARNIDCGYSLEPPRRGGSNEYPQSMF